MLGARARLVASLFMKMARWRPFPSPEKRDYR